MKKEAKICVIAALTVMMLWQFSMQNAYAIVNGVPDGAAHPYVGMMVFQSTDGYHYRCSGSLIAPNVFLTAGHCTIDAIEAWISFGENLEGQNYLTFPSHSTRFYTKMPYDGLGPGLPGWAAGFDVGIVILDQPVTLGKYASLPSFTAESLPRMAYVTLVGYGVQEQVRGPGITPPTSWTGLRVRMKTDAQIIPSRDTINGKYLSITSNIGKDKGSTMFGDSGGPVLVGDTVIAVTSFGLSYNRGGVSYYSRVDTPEVKTWIQNPF